MTPPPREEYRDLVTEVANHPVLREFREETRRRLDRLESRIEALDDRIAGIGHNQDQRGWKIEALESSIHRLEQRGRNGGNGIEGTLLKLVFFGLIALISALASAKLVGLEGLFKG